MGKKENGKKGKIGKKEKMEKGKIGEKKYGERKNGIKEKIEKKEKLCFIYQVIGIFVYRGIGTGGLG